MTPQDDPVEQIFTALAQLRGRRLPREPRDGPHGGDAGPGPRGGRGPRGPGFPPFAMGGPEGEWPGTSLHGRLASGPARLRLLEVLAAASGPLTVSELGEILDVGQPRASRLVQQGVELGFVRREADPDDARRTRIALTDAGRSLVRGFRGERRDTIAGALADFTPAERAEFARLLSKFAAAWTR
ncbi:MAG: MarR family winged helix-turn-helix transcriptional regulator [Microbacterium sp.]|uniref:MarR family winged helix-turn-helix transcriptional regulator n=1 Tax=Microbacterium sp. TaxID=51671 RepID=UPI0039E242B6